MLHHNENTSMLESSKLPTYFALVEGTTKRIEAPNCHNKGDVRAYVTNLGYRFIKAVERINQLTLSK